MESEFEDELHLRIPEKQCSLEQDLATFRDEYFKKTGEERVRYRREVAQMASWAVGQKIIIAIDSPSAHQQDHYRAAYISANLLNQAIESWDLGEDFTPTLESIDVELIFRWRHIDE
jgi:hypothetical protein